MPSKFFAIACFALVGAALTAVPATAQMPAAPTPAMVPAPAQAPLVIPAPPGGKLRVEMDARGEDLLGMVKSFLKGIGETGTPASVTPSQAAAEAPNPVAEAIAGGDLAAMLKDVNHIHFAVYELAGPSAPLVMPALPMKPGLKKSIITAAPTPPASPVPMFDSNSFYESAFAAEGAHRILYTDADAYKLVMVGFPDRHGFAFAASGGGYVLVDRSDGYPNLEVLSAFISHVTTAVLNSKTGKKMMNSTLDSGKLAMPETKMLPTK